MICENCKKEVQQKAMGTSHRNHCPYCGFSKHVDEKKGDRNSVCGGLMRPVGLSFKSNEEICLVHVCDKCQKVNKNRIAGDDNEQMLLKIFTDSLNLDQSTKDLMLNQNIQLLSAEDESKLTKQLFG